MKIVNLTMHDIDLHAPDGTVRTYARSGIVARVAQHRQQIGSFTIDDNPHTIPLNRSTFGAITDLPDPVDGTIYVAAMLVVQAACAAGRTDVYATDDAVRDDAGKIIGNRAFCLP